MRPFYSSLLPRFGENVLRARFSIAVVAVIIPPHANSNITVYNLDMIFIQSGHCAVSDAQKFGFPYS